MILGKSTEIEEKSDSMSRVFVILAEDAKSHETMIDPQYTEENAKQRFLTRKEGLLQRGEYSSVKLYCIDIHPCVGTMERVIYQILCDPIVFVEERGKLIEAVERHE